MRFNKVLKIFVETMISTIAFLDLIWWRRWIFLLAGVLYFICDFILHRREALLNFRASRPLRDAMKTSDVKEIENYYTSLEGFSTPEKRALKRPPLERYFYHLRYEQVERLLDRYARGSKMVLDLGCGFGGNALYICRNLKVPVVGLDLDYLKLVEATRRSTQEDLCKDIGYVTGDACHPPLKASSFDCILMTEVLEHLICPEQGLAACAYLLHEGGILILTTPSRHNLNYTTNPFIILEKILSLAFSRILPPYHNLHCQFEYNRKKPEPQYGMHHHFAYQQLSVLLRNNGFKSIFQGSFEVEIPLFPIIEFLFKGKVEAIRKYVRPLETGLATVPVVKHLGQHLVCVAQKGLG